MEFNKFEYSGNEIEYLVDYPKNFDRNKKYPLIFYIHGYGFVGKDILDLAERCPVSRDRIPEELDFIIVAPLCKNESWIFKFETVCKFIDSIAEKPFVDKGRIYLTGTSMGGYTSWMLLQCKKTFFAAAVVCCGGGQYWAARIGSFNNIPIKAVHGKLDDTVFWRESEIMAECINSAGGNCELVLHDDLAHDVWTRTFSDKDTYYWLMKNHR